MEFKIGEVAGIFDISVKALRLYDKLGLLKPGHTDGRTGYRYYTAEQIHAMQTITSLKSVGFSLMEIKQVLDDENHPDRLLALLAEKKRTWVDRIEAAKFNVRLISEMEGNAAAEAGRERTRDDDPERRARRISRLASMDNSKVVTSIEEALWV